MFHLNVRHLIRLQPSSSLMENLVLKMFWIIWFLCSVLLCECGPLPDPDPPMFGEVQSPRYPQPYPPNLQQQWELRVPEGFQIRLTFTHLDIEATAGCYYDSLTRSSELVRCLLNDHKKTRVPGEPRDFLDCYLDEMDKTAEDSSFSEEKLIFTGTELLFAGSDTTSNTLLTAFLYLMNHPHIQERCQQEIDRVLEGKDRACFDDRHQMPYVQAVVHESQRIANTLPLSIFHCTTKDSELMGYSIPKGTMIIQNMSSVLNEEGQWKYPHEFNPENFLNDQGEFVKPDAFMPFSAGPRMCLGEGLARMELFLIMVTLLRKFKFIWPEDAGEPDYTLIFGISMTPKPYPMKVQNRL